jgi:rhodanese-related sulfurtransferase
MIGGMMPHHIPAVTVEEIPEGAFILDVREHDEWAVGHAPQAVHLPMQDVPARMADIPTEGNVVVACRVGARSAQVTAYLLSQGRDNVVNLDGGMRAWHAAGRPLVTSENGQEAFVL